MRAISLLFFISFLFETALSGQKGFVIKKQQSPVTIDGELSEPGWVAAQTVSDFGIIFPADSGMATAPTEVKVFFDEKNLYIGAICHQKRSDYTVQSRKRDFTNGTSDVFNVVISPFKDGVNGFLFGVNPLGIQREALIDNGQTVSFEWDNSWFSDVKNSETFWTVEIAIPFKTLRFNNTENDISWDINFVRTRLKNVEISAWQPIPRQYSAFNLAFCGKMHWETPPPKVHSNIALVPYVSMRYDEAFIRNNNKLTVTDVPKDFKAAAGGDVKIGLTPSLNLDLTINPDFSQVEVDRQVANLSRFELFFPETRQFFLENRDLFAMYGFPSSRPFFSRRIGIANNPVSRQTVQVPILGGARLNGKLNNNLRLGVLDMQTKSAEWDSTNALPGANYFVATVQQKVFARSFLGAFLVNKQNFLQNLTDAQIDKGTWQPWNRVAGLEYNLYSADNRWEGEWYYHRSFSPLTNRQGGSLASFLGYSVRKFNARLGYMRVDDNFDAEAGFVTRKDVQSFFPAATVYFFPKNKRLADKILQFGVGVNGDFTYSTTGKSLDRYAEITAGVDMKDLSSLQLSAFTTYTYLTFDFDPTNLNKPGTAYLPKGSSYTYNGLDLNYTSSTSGNLQGALSVRVAEYFSGDIFRVDGRIAYRLQPLGLLSMACTYSKITMPEPYPSASFFLVGPKAELAFSKKFFGSVFVQYNTQINNFSTNARLQWRFAPVSDVFLVYTGNTFAEVIPETQVKFFSPKNNAIVLKVVYWFNA